MLCSVPEVLRVLRSGLYWRHLLRLFPLLVMLAIGQGVMRLGGNSAALGIGWGVTALDTTVFLLVFMLAACWVVSPLARVTDGMAGARRPLMVESWIQLWPLRALRGYLAAGLVFALWVMGAVGVASAVHGFPWSWPSALAFGFSVLFGAGVLAPALAVSATVAHAVGLRAQLARKGLFTGGLDGRGRRGALTDASRRPWLVFAVTGLIPTTLLSLFVVLALWSGGAEERFVLAQAMVVLAMSLAASVHLVWTLSHTLGRVARELDRGLRHLAEGRFDARVPVLTEDELGDLARGLNTAMAGLAERARLEGSLAIAGEIQRGLLPDHDPEIPGWQVSGLQRSCFAVGGDYWHHLPLEDGRWWLLVADVSGKGYPAALTMANLQAMLQGLARLNFPVEEALAYLNDALCENLTGGRFVTLFLGKLQPESHSLVWVNAGHVPPLLASAKGVRRLEASAPPLGMAPDLRFTVGQETLAPGDVLLACTDGVTEARNAQGEMFGDRLPKWLAAHRDLPAARLCEALADAVTRFTDGGPDDDLTVLCARREEEAS
ncbi:MAG: SpoIIE family protein phosphatase [Mariprofundaceae bacterium]